MELGEYFLHVYVHCSTKLRSPSGQLDSVIRVRALGEAKSTRVIRGIGANSLAFWGEHLHFHRNFTSREELEEANFQLSVFDYNIRARLGLRRGAKGGNLIGSAGGALARVYATPQHALLGHWLVLTNPAREPGEVFGFVQVSLGFTRGGEERVPFGADPPTLAGELCLPAEVRVTHYQIIAHVVRGRHIVKGESLGDSDPFVAFELGAQNVRTPIVRDTKNPVFNKKLFLPYTKPTLFDFLVIRLFDKGPIGEEVIATQTLSLADVERGDYASLIWFQFYGAPPKPRNKAAARLMNNCSDTASTYRGELLFSVRAEASPRPVYAVRGLTAEEAETTAFRSHRFYIIFDIVFVQGLLLTAKNARLVLNWGNLAQKSEEYPLVNGVICPFFRFELQQTVELAESVAPSDALGLAPPLIFSIEVEGRAISFVRLHAAEIGLRRKDSSKDFLVQMSIDSSVSDVRRELGGQALLRAGTEHEELFTPQLYGFGQSSRYGFYRAKLIAYLFQAKGLPPTDSKGTANVLVQIYHFGSAARSTVCRSTLSPIWNEHVVLDTHLLDGSAPPILLTLWDESGQSHEFIGQCQVELRTDDLVTHAHQLQTPPQPRWFSLRGENDLPAGKLLAAFHLLVEPLFIEAEPLLERHRLLFSLPQTLYHLKIVLLGLRGLVPVGVLPMRRAHVRIETGTLYMGTMSEEPPSPRIVVPSMTGGADPSIGRVVSFCAMLSPQLLLMPSLTCTVIDEGIAGENLIGTFYLSLAHHALLSRISLASRLRELARRRPNGDALKEHLRGLIDYLESVSELNQTFIAMNEDGPRLPQTQLLPGTYNCPDGVSRPIIIRPKYTSLNTSNMSVEQEIDIPDSQTYYAYGYRARQIDTKQYRLMLPGAIEQSGYFASNAFSTIRIMRGSRSQTKIKQNKLQEGNAKLEKFGAVRGGMLVLEDTVLARLAGLGLSSDEALLHDIPRSVEEFQMSPRDLQLLSSVRVFAYIYVLDARFFDGDDVFGKCDAYFTVSLGTARATSATVHGTDVPKFFQTFALRHSFPGAPNVRLAFFDHNTLLRDKFIGETLIDAEARFFDATWKQYAEKPVERLPISRSTSALPQGEVRLWLDIVTEEEVQSGRYAPVDIRPRPPTELELRVVIWEVHGVPAIDILGNSDIYVALTLPAFGLTQKTETYYRSFDGYASFNYRFVFRFKIEEGQRADQLVGFLKIFDRSLLLDDTLVADATLDFAEIISGTLQSERRRAMRGQPLNGKGKAHIFAVRTAFQKGGRLEGENHGKCRAKVVLSVECLTIEEAESSPAGRGRGDPNQDPYLPPPVRQTMLGVSLARLLRTQLGPHYRAIISIAVFVLLVVFLVLIFVPQFAATLAATAITRSIF